MIDSSPAPIANSIASVEAEARESKDASKEAQKAQAELDNYVALSRPEHVKKLPQRGCSV